MQVLRFSQRRLLHERSVSAFLIAAYTALWRDGLQWDWCWWVRLFDCLNVAPLVLPARIVLIDFS